MRAASRLRCPVLPPTLRARLDTPPIRGSKEATTAASESVSPNSRQTDDQVEVVKGWLKSVRAHKNVVFAELNDGSTSEGLQAVFKGQSRIEGLDAGASVRLSGKLVPSRGAGQSREFLVQTTEILGSCDPEIYPIQKKHLPAPVLRDMAHLRFRTTQTAAVMRVRDAMMRDWHDWFEENEFVHIHTPFLTSSDCEGAGETFGITTTNSSPGSSSSGSIGPSTSTATTTTTVQQGSVSSKSPTPIPTPTSTAPTPTPTPTPEPFFPYPVNLTVSSQLHLEAPTHSLSRTYTLSPSFRAEPSQTSRHLSEFYMLEGEVVLDTLGELMDVVEDSIRSVLEKMMMGDGRRHIGLRRDLERLYASDHDQQHDQSQERGQGPRFETEKERETGMGRMKEIQEIIRQGSKFHRMTYTAAIQEIEARHARDPFEIPPDWDSGLASIHEKYLASKYGPTFVTHYPRHLKPFYMLPSNADPSFCDPHLLGSGSSSGSVSSSDSQPTSSPSYLTSNPNLKTNEERETVACFDLLFPTIGELAGGSLREHRLPNLISAMKTHRLDVDKYGWYLDLRRYGSVPHGGWGMGWDRWISWVTGIGNLRDVVAFPRWKGHCDY